jgi:hypothetical protein
MRSQICHLRVSYSIYQLLRGFSCCYALLTCSSCHTDTSFFLSGADQEAFSSVPQLLSHPTVQRALAGCVHKPSEKQHAHHIGHVHQLQDTLNASVRCGQGQDETSNGAWDFPAAQCASSSVSLNSTLLPSKNSTRTDVDVSDVQELDPRAAISLSVEEWFSTDRPAAVGMSLDQPFWGSDRGKLWGFSRDRDYLNATHFVEVHVCILCSKLQTNSSQRVNFFIALSFPFLSEPRSPSVPAHSVTHSRLWHRLIP